jgi:hypothetical protein
MIVLMKSILGVAAAAVAILGLTACSGATAAPAQTPTASPTPTRSQIAKTLETCHVTSNDYATPGDSGYTVTLQGAPEYTENGLAMTDIACVLKGVSVPDSVVSEMDATRALDGTQKESWDKYQASWTYHPDHGLRIVLTESKGTATLPSP